MFYKKGTVLVCICQVLYLYTLLRYSKIYIEYRTNYNSLLRLCIVPTVVFRAPFQVIKLHNNFQN